MRVLQIVADGKPGGGTTHVLQILKGLRHAVSFYLITEEQSYLMKEAGALGIPCQGLRFFISRLNPAIPFQLRASVMALQPDLVHVHGGRAGFFFTVSLLKVPMVYTVHGFHFIEKSPKIRRMALMAERWNLRRACHSIFVSKYDVVLAEKFQLLSGRDKRSVIYPGLSLNNLPRPLPQGLLHIGFIGRLEHQKDPLLFVEMMEFLPEYSATIVGGGALAPMIKQEIARRGLGGRVHMVGELSHGEALDILATFSVVVLTSRWEGLPVLVLESMGMGVPVVSMNVSGLEEIIHDEINGMLVEKRSGEDLAEKVKKITNNEDLRIFLIKKAQETIQEKFSSETMMDSILEIYQEMSASHAGH
ncbi:glycosyltransferase [Nitrospira sp. T9]|uniref:glycosyltransferase n=1 Tax=unclassified Nitrospira TaxID=2652172 RepID=UPI003F966CA0